MKWWGDIIIVIFSILLIGLGVVFICLAFTESDIAPVKELKKVAGGEG